MEVFNDLDLTKWRRISFSESFENFGRTWRNARFVGTDGKVHWTLNAWCSGFVEVFHTKDGDNDQLVNLLDLEAGSVANKIGQDIVNEWMPVISGIGKCLGATCQWNNIRNETKSELETCVEATNKACKPACDTMGGNWSLKCASPDCQGCLDCPWKVATPNY